MAEESNNKKLSPVVSGSTSVTKNTDPSNLVSKFLVDGVKTAGKSMISDVLFPQCKQAVYNAIISGINVLFWGPGGMKKSTTVLGTGTKVNYAGANKAASVQKVTATVKATMDPEDVTFETRMDAQNVYDTMLEVIDQYEKVSLADFLELANVANDNFTYRKYGWTNLPPADIRRLGNGSYYIRFPKMQVLQN